MKKRYIEPTTSVILLDHCEQLMAGSLTVETGGVYDDDKHVGGLSKSVDFSYDEDDF